jgi:predicted metal-dependent phosphoesterase TrpH
MTTLRADLHVHSLHSRRSGNFQFLKSRDCYSKPEDIYRIAKARGMDLVTITDHDSIDGCLELLDRHPDAGDLFVSEEISCRCPVGDIEVHLGVYGIDERLHRELQSLRGNVFDVIAWLREEGVFFSLNHLFHFYRRQAPLSAYLRLLDEVPALEGRNGTMLQAHNELVVELARKWCGPVPIAGGPLGVVGGSDAHTLRRVGRTWTTGSGRTRHEFLESLRLGHGSVGGEHGGAAAVAGDAYGVIRGYVASLAGSGPDDHNVLERAGFLLFALLSIPLQFLPLGISVAGKLAEAREVGRAARELAARLDGRAGDRPALEART